MGKNVYSFNEIKDVYHNQYLFNIYQLLINTNYTFQFLSLDDMILLEENVNNPLLRPDLFLENFSKSIALCISLCYNKFSSLKEIVAH